MSAIKTPGFNLVHMQSPFIGAYHFSIIAITHFSPILTFWHSYPSSFRLLTRGEDFLNWLAWYWLTNIVHQELLWTRGRQIFLSSLYIYGRCVRWEGERLTNCFRKSISSPQRNTWGLAIRRSSLEGAASKGHIGNIYKPLWASPFSQAKATKGPTVVGFVACGNDVRSSQWWENSHSLLLGHNSRSHWWLRKVKSKWSSGESITQANSSSSTPWPPIDRPDNYSLAWFVEQALWMGEESAQTSFILNPMPVKVSLTQALSYSSQPLSTRPPFLTLNEWFKQLAIFDLVKLSIWSCVRVTWTRVNFSKVKSAFVD